MVMQDMKSIQPPRRVSWLGIMIGVNILLIVDTVWLLSHVS